MDRQMAAMVLEDLLRKIERDKIPNMKYYKDAIEYAVSTMNALDTLRDMHGGMNDR